MYSSLVELAGFAGVTDGVYRLAGSGWACVCGGILAVILGISLDDNQIKRSLRVAGRASIRGTLRLVHFRSQSLPSIRSPHPELKIDPQAQAMAEQAARSHEARLRLANEGELYPESPFAVS